METIGSLIDRLSVVNLRIWKCEDVKRSSESDKEIAEATRKTNIANQQRNDLIEQIDLKLNHMVSTGELQKLYGQGSTKMYGK